MIGEKWREAGQNNELGLATANAEKEVVASMMMVERTKKLVNVAVLLEIMRQRSSLGSRCSCVKEPEKAQRYLLASRASTKRITVGLQSDQERHSGEFSGRGRVQDKVVPNIATVNHLTPHHHMTLSPHITVIIS